MLASPSHPPALTSCDSPAMTGFPWHSCSAADVWQDQCLHSVPQKHVSYFITIVIVLVIISIGFWYCKKVKSSYKLPRIFLRFLFSTLTLLFSKSPSLLLVENSLSLPRFCLCRRVDPRADSAHGSLGIALLLLEISPPLPPHF